MSSPTRLLTVLTVVFALASVSALARSIDKIHVDIRPLASGKARYSGSVESRNRDCERRRTVVVSTRRSRLVKTTTNTRGAFDEQGKAPRQGVKVTVKVRPKGLCPKLTGSSIAR